MVIFSWNCRGKFREKCNLLNQYDADIYVIQECENPQKYPTQFSSFYSNYLWFGENSNKGLGIFAKPNIFLSPNNWPSYCLRHFLSVRVNNEFDLLGVWACSPYIEEYYIYQSINIIQYSNNMIIIGDFNSNAKWDKKHGSRNHSAVTEQLQGIGLLSAYHYVTKEIPGQESQNTFCMYKNPAKQYHIDYCFISPSKIEDFAILNFPEWLNYSDHFPIQIKIK